MYSRRGRRTRFVPKTRGSWAIYNLQREETASQWNGLAAIAGIIILGLIVLDKFGSFTNLALIVLAIVAIVGGVATYLLTRPRAPKPVPPPLDPLSYNAIYGVDGSDEPR
jgi:hypothetical protein